MAKELVVLCDMCGGSAGYANVPIRIGAVKPQTLDLCDGDFDRLLAPVLDALDAFGASTEHVVPEQVVVAPKPEPKRSRDRNAHRQQGPFECLVEGCVWPTLKHAGTLQQHVTNSHGVAYKDYLAQYGDPTPLTPEQAAAIVITSTCPRCAKVYSTATGTKWPQVAMHAHYRGHHGVIDDEGQIKANTVRTMRGLT